MVAAGDGRARQRTITAVGLSAVVVIAAVDAAATPVALRLGPLYVIPILAVAAWGPAGAGMVTAVMSAAADTSVSWFLGVHHVEALALIGASRLVIYLGCAHLVRRLLKEQERLRRLASVDYATGLYNRRTFYDLTEAEIKRSRRHGHPLSLLYVDVDDLKAINDQHGHSVGDAALVMIAELLQRTIRSEDLVARLGGDEFAILLPETGQDGATAVAANITTRLRALVPPHPMPPDHPLTVSIGQSRGDRTIPDLHRLLRLADDDMYANKRRRSLGSA